MIVEGLKKAIETDKSLSRGTLRNYDLINSFLGLIENTPEYEQMLASPGSPVHPAQSRLWDEGDSWWKSEEACYLLEMLFDILDYYAPEGYYFGVHAGDGSDFGYWEIDYAGYVMYGTDTLY